MASRKKSSGGTRRSGSSTKTRGRATPSNDAIALLKADHRQVEGWFEQFKKARAQERKQELAEWICDALRIHAQLEEEIFYPEFLDVVGDEDLHHEAEVEHAGAKHLIEEIEQLGPDDEYFDARVNVLAEMVKHHVREEEQPGGLFAKTRKSTIDTQEMGERIAARKAELKRESSDGGRRGAREARVGGIR